MFCVDQWGCALLQPVPNLMVVQSQVADDIADQSFYFHITSLSIAKSNLATSWSQTAWFKIDRCSQMTTQLCLWYTAIMCTSAVV